MTVRLTMLSVSAVVAGILSYMCGGAGGILVKVFQCDGGLFGRVLLSLVMMKWRGKLQQVASCLSTASPLIGG